MASVPTIADLLERYREAKEEMVRQGNLDRNIGEAMQKTYEHILGHHPNHEWLINVIFMMDPANEIFAKNYEPPKKPKAVFSQPPMLSNGDFFLGLPMSKKKGTLRLPVPKEKRLEEEM